MITEKQYQEINVLRAKGFGLKAATDKIGTTPTDYGNYKTRLNKNEKFPRVRGSRKPNLNREQRHEIYSSVKKLTDGGAMNITQACDKLGTSTMNYYRAKKMIESGSDYESKNRKKAGMRDGARASGIIPRVRRMVKQPEFMDVTVQSEKSKEFLFVRGSYDQVKEFLTLINQ